MAEQNGNNKALVNNIANMAKEQAKEKAKSEIKKKILAKLLPALPYILLGIVIIVLVGSVFDVFLDIGKRVSEGIESVWKDFLTLFQNNLEESKISDEMVLSYIEKLEKATNVDFDSLKLLGDIDYSDPKLQDEIKKAKIKYVKKFLKSQLISQEVSRPKIAGKVLPKYVAKGQAPSKNPLITMDYLKPEEFYELMDKETKEDYTNYFTVNEETGDIILCTYVETQINDQEPTRIYHPKIIDYKKIISKYSTPAQFFIYLGEIVQNPEFLSKFADLIIKDNINGTGTYNTQIDLTFFETTKVTITEEVNTYYEATKVLEDVQYDEDTTIQVLKEVVSEEPTVETTITKVTTSSLSPSVSYANTWMAEETMKYYYDKGKLDIVEQSTEKIPDEQGGVGSSYKVGQVKSVVVREQTAQYEEIATEDYVYRAGERPDEHPEYTSFVDLLQQEFKIPNSTRKVAAGGNFRSGAEWFFTLLAQDDQTKESELFMKYVLNRYTNGQVYGNITWDSIVESGIYSDYMVDVGSGGGSSSGGGDYNGGSTGTGSTGTGSSGGTAVSGNDIDAHDSSLFVTKSELIDVINKNFSSTAKNNLLSCVDAFMEIQNSYGINAIYAIALVQSESNCGTNWEGIYEDTYNWMSLGGNSSTGRKDKYKDEVYWRQYSSFYEATLDLGKWYVNNGHNFYFEGGKYTVEELMGDYNRGSTWEINMITYWMKKMYSSIGINLNSQTSML